MGKYTEFCYGLIALRIFVKQCAADLFLFDSHCFRIVNFYTKFVSVVGLQMYFSL